MVQLPVAVSARAVGIGVIAAALAALMGLLTWGMLNKAPVTGRSGVTRVGKPAPEFRLQQFDGKEFVLSEHSGRPVVINFWASWCPPCRAEAIALERTWRRFRERDLVLVGVNVQDFERDARAFLRDFDVTYPNGPDVGGRVTIDYGVIGLPVTFFVNRAGVVERRWVGAIDDATLQTWVQQLVESVKASGDTDAQNLKEFFKLDRAGD